MNEMNRTVEMDICPDCGFNPQNCDCDEIDIDMLDCTHCGGSGDCAELYAKATKEADKK